MSRRLLLRMGPAILLLVVLAVGEVAAGTITGRVFTAEQADSVANGAAVTLIFRVGDGEMTRQRIETDATGHFHFIDVASDTSIAYVLQISHRGRDFLSAPIRFEPGQDEIDYSVLLTDQAPDQGGLPPGHPPMPGTQPPQGEPARQSPVHTILLVFWIGLIFALLALLARPHRAGPPAAQVPPAIRNLVRDIASLDNRHADGVIGEEEYRKVREGLITRLRSLQRGPMG